MSSQQPHSCQHGSLGGRRMVRRLETRGREAREALHGPSRAAWHLVHLVSWGAHGYNLDLGLTEMPKMWTTSVSMSALTCRSQDRIARPLTTGLQTYQPAMPVVGTARAPLATSCRTVTVSHAATRGVQKRAHIAYTAPKPARPRHVAVALQWEAARSSSSTPASSPCDGCMLQETRLS
jgi:hypothetical protein